MCCLLLYRFRIVVNIFAGSMCLDDGEDVALEQTAELMQGADPLTCHLPRLCCIGVSCSLMQNQKAREVKLMHCCHDSFVIPLCCLGLHFPFGQGHCRAFQGW